MTASSTPSEIWSAILSGWPSVTDSELNRYSLSFSWLMDLEEQLRGRVVLLTLDDCAGGSDRRRSSAVNPVCSPNVRSWRTSKKPSDSIPVLMEGIAARNAGVAVRRAPPRLRKAPTARGSVAATTVSPLIAYVGGSRRRPEREGVHAGDRLGVEGTGRVRVRGQRAGDRSWTRASTSRRPLGSSVWAANPITGAAAPVAIHAVKPWRRPSRSRSASSDASLPSTLRTESYSAGAAGTRAAAGGCPARVGRGEHRIVRARGHARGERGDRAVGLAGADAAGADPQPAVVRRGGGADGPQPGLVEQGSDRAEGAAARRAQAARGHVELRRPRRAFQRALERGRLRQRRRVAAGDVDRALDGQLPPGHAEAADERRRVAAAEAPHDRDRIVRGGPRAARRAAAAPRPSARRGRSRSPASQAPAAEVDERGGGLVAQPRPDVALEIEAARRGRDRLQRGGACRGVAGELRRERRPGGARPDRRGRC